MENTGARPYDHCKGGGDRNQTGDRPRELFQAIATAVEECTIWGLARRTERGQGKEAGCDQFLGRVRSSSARALE